MLPKLLGVKRTEWALYWPLFWKPLSLYLSSSTFSCCARNNINLCSNSWIACYTHPIIHIYSSATRFFVCGSIRSTLYSCTHWIIYHIEHSIWNRKTLVFIIGIKAKHFYFLGQILFTIWNFKSTGKLWVDTFSTWYTHLHVNIVQLVFPMCLKIVVPLKVFETEKDL